MKELSIEEKEKRYDEVYKKVAVRFGYNVADEIFLKESEDERVWRVLIEGFKRYDDGALFNGCLVRDIVAWLEKQGEQKPQRIVSAEAKEAMYNKPAWSEEDEMMYKKIETAINSYYAPFSRDAEEMSEWFKKFKNKVQPQTTWKPSEEQIDALDAVIDEYDGYPEFDSLVSLKNDLKKLKGE